MDGISYQQMEQLDINPEFAEALKLLESDYPVVFITGRAGTGKSTLLSYYRQQARKSLAVLAPTGVAALNVRGQTIHSFFRFKPGITLARVGRTRNRALYRRLDAVITDEASMLRADLLDCIDRFLRLNGPCEERPFGGIQMVFIGDLYQLPPVVTPAERGALGARYASPYFYSARALAGLSVGFVELTKVYRQHDAGFLKLLNAIRDCSITPAELAALNQRVLPGFTPPPEDFFICLTTTNAAAQEVNEARLAELKTELCTSLAAVDGDFGQEYQPTAPELRFKVGAQVMLLNNDRYRRWVNGSVGKITGIGGTGDKPTVRVELLGGETVEVAPFTWEITRLLVENEELTSEVVGSFTQYPFMLAWAVTIHKSQGKTFERVVVDLGWGAFAHGQTYVALSRCTSLAGLVLRRPVSRRDILVDGQIQDFLAGLKRA